MPYPPIKVLMNAVQHKREQLLGILLLEITELRSITGNCELPTPGGIEKERERERKREREGEVSSCAQTPVLCSLTLNLKGVMLLCCPHQRSWTNSP